MWRFQDGIVAAWRLVEVIKAGKTADENSRVCHAVLKASRAGCSK